MMPTLTFILVGALFVVMALATSVLKRLPLSTSLLYLGAGYAVGPGGLGLIDLGLEGGRIDSCDQLTLGHFGVEISEQGQNVPRHL